MSETRKLAAILVADVVGYSRLAGADEERTLARLRGLRSDLIRNIESGRRHLFAISLDKIVQPRRIASCCQKAIPRSKHSLRDIAAQTTCASCYQPYFGHQNLRLVNSEVSPASRPSETPEVLTKREIKCVNAKIEKLDFESSVCDGTFLPDELI